MFLHHLDHFESIAITFGTNPALQKIQMRCEQHLGDRRDVSPIVVSLPWSDRSQDFMSKFISGVRRFVREEEAPTMVEYGLLVVVIALVVVVGARALGLAITGWFNTAAAG